MKNGRDSCLFGEELVSYMYDELPSAERHSFEDHLLKCSSCTAEFADLSMSRLGVYEWHRDEFVPLETPRFAIPYTTPEPTHSWLDAIRGFLATPARLSFAGGALALVVLALGAVYMVNFDQDTLAGVQVQPPLVEKTQPETFPTVVNPPGEVAGANILSNNELDTITVRPKGVASNSQRGSAVAQAKAVKKPVERHLTARGNQPAKAPRLGSFEEIEDKSLRLADLVADIDSYRK
jgi:hypothetical protein